MVMKLALGMSACLGIAALTGAVGAQTVHVSVLGTVEWNQFVSGALTGVHAGDAAAMEFDVDANVYTNNPSYPTRGYNDPHVDGFFIGTNTSLDNEIPIDIGVPNYGIAFSRTFSNENVLPSLDILQAQGTWHYEFISSYNWTVQRGEFSTPLGISYDSITVAMVQACGSADFDCDGDVGTDADIEAFFACIAGTCPESPCVSTADFNGDGDIGTDADIEAFFRVLGGGSC
jgi:hypothetical protein